MSTQKITIEPVTRIEGHAKVTIHLDEGGGVEHAYFHVNEFRGFEKFCEGRMYFEMPSITPRICGICPVAYQMSAVHAMENAFDVQVDGALRELRRLLYCGEWIESHVLHVYMLHAPDFLGYEDAIAMAGDHPKTVKKALRLTQERLAQGRESSTVRSISQPVSSGRFPYQIVRYWLQKKSTLSRQKANSSVARSLCRASGRKRCSPQRLRNDIAAIARRARPEKRLPMKYQPPNSVLNQSGSSAMMRSMPRNVKAMA